MGAELKRKAHRGVLMSEQAEAGARDAGRPHGGDEASEAEISAHDTLALVRGCRRATLGTLASFLAHEVNQPLTAILNYARTAVRLLNSGVVEPERLLPLLHKLSDQVERAAKTVARPRTLVRNVRPQREPLDVGHVVTTAVRLLDEQARAEGVTVEIALPPALPTLCADPNLICLVLLELLDNALDALCESQDRRLTLSAGADARSLTLSVADSGLGLSEEVRKNAFEPFFTTKPGAAGLGLSLALDVVEAHGGQLLATVRETGGAAFHIRLPLQP
jgi:two-component system sensor kinase FixL